MIRIETANESLLDTECIEAGQVDSVYDRVF